MRGAAIAKNMKQFKGCVTPYVKGKNATCTTPEIAEETFKEVKSVKDSIKYVLPCDMVKTEILLESKNIEETLYESDKGKNHTLIFKLPSTLVSTEASFSYSFLSFFAEFGSWLGLFTGLAVVQVSHILLAISL